MRDLRSQESKHKVQNLMSDPRLLYKQHKFCEKQKELTDEFKAKVILYPFPRCFQNYLTKITNSPTCDMQRNVTASYPPPPTPNVQLTFLVGKIDMWGFPNLYCLQQVCIPFFLNKILTIFFKCFMSLAPGAIRAPRSPINFLGARMALGTKSHIKPIRAGPFECAWVWGGGGDGRWSGKCPRSYNTKLLMIWKRNLVGYQRNVKLVTYGVLGMLRHHYVMITP